MIGRRPLARALAFAAAAVVPAGGCSGGGGEAADSARAKLAGDLVQCQNQTSGLKDQIAELKTELAKLKAVTDPTRKLEPIDVKAGTGGGEATAPHREGDLPPEAVQKVLKAKAPSLRACYEKGLKRNPSLQYVQAVNVHFAVKNTGNAIEVRFSPRHDEEMERCMAQAITKWSFPTFSGDPVQFEAPVNLVAK